METWGNFDQQDLVENNPDKINRSVSLALWEAIDDLSSPKYSLDDIHDMVSELSANDQVFSNKLWNLQIFSSNALQQMLRDNMTSLQECTIKDIQLSDYFWIDLHKYLELKEELSWLGLHLEELIDQYKEHIDTHLSALNSDVQDKVKKSIWIRIQNLSEKIADIQSDTGIDEWTRNRWIINTKLQDELWFINNRLLPSLEAYQKIKSGTDIPEKYNITIFWEVDLDTVNRYSRPDYRANPDYINMGFKLTEVEQLIWASVDEDGNFVEARFWLYTQSIFNMNRHQDSNLMSDLWVEKIEATLLSPEDMKTEKEAILYFMAAIAVQVWGEIVWWPGGMIVGAGIDLYDIFNTEETLLQIVQAAGLVDWEYKVEKTLVDNVLASLWLIPWWTQLIKWTKLAKYLENIEISTLTKAMDKIKSKIGMSKSHDMKQVSKLDKLSDPDLLKLLKEEFKNFPYFNEVIEKFILDEKHSMNIVTALQNPKTREVTITQLKEILKLWEQHITSKEMAHLIMSVYKWNSDILKTTNFNRMGELSSELLVDNPELYSIWEKLSYKQKWLLEAYAQRLNTDIHIALKRNLNTVLEWIPKSGWFPRINSRAKGADWIEDKIKRMIDWNGWKNARPEYNLSNMPDAVWWRITVTDIWQLEQVMKNIENVFWKKNLYEIENFYSSSKKNKPYRVITYTMTIDWVPCELQVTTLKSSLTADLWHNTGYKPIHDLPEDVIEKIGNLQRQVTIFEHSLLN